MIVLSLDTSTPRITVGVVQVLRPHEVLGGPERPPWATLAEDHFVNALGHAEQLMPLISTVLARADLRLADVEAIVVGRGPGPFTGLRVGLATAAALGDALDLAVHGVPSHDGTAAALTARSDRPVGDFLVVTDARRREVYLSGYRADGHRLSGPMVCAPADVDEATAGCEPRYLTGAGALLLAAVLDLPVIETGPGLPAGLVRRAAKDLLTGAIPGPLQPLYLRRPDATPPAPRRPVPLS